MQLDRGSLIILSTMGLDLFGSGQVFAALPHLLPDMTGLTDICVDTVCLRAGSRRPEPTSDPAFSLAGSTIHDAIPPRGDSCPAVLSLSFQPGNVSNKCLKSDSSCAR